MRIRVTDVLDLLAAGGSPSAIVDELPDLGLNDVEAALRYAPGRRCRDDGQGLYRRVR